MKDKIILDRLEIECVIGIFDWERKTKQKVEISFELDCDISKASALDDIKQTVNYKDISKKIIALIEPSQFFLIETMAEKVAQICLANNGVQKAKVTVSKPGAVRGSQNVSIQVVRPKHMSKIYFGLGGNIEPEQNFATGIELIRSRFHIVTISPVYKSEVWGAKDQQADYLNLVLELETDKDIFAVRSEARWIEELVGRNRTLDKFEPRQLDIDLLLYDELVGTHEGGILPHKQLLTQQFVYLPMLDIAPELIVPGEGKALREMEPVFADPNLRIEKVDLDFSLTS